MRVGETVSHYEILAQLGGGGMGVVYTARDLRLGRQVAIKFLSPEVVRDTNAKSRFIREARAASSLEHPNICTIHDVGETPEGLFLVMALYDGETLRDRIERGPLRLLDALRIGAQIARGLAAAHAAGIVHRDIKPANIMLPKAGEAKILDFGLAKLAGTAQQLTRSGTTLGTLAYMAPEQARSGIVDARSDLWALGVVLYEMIAGRLPFAGEGSGIVLYSILERDPEPLSNLRAELPAEVDQVIEELLDKDPERRLGSAAELATTLEHLASGQSMQRTTAMPLSPTKSRSRKVSRRAPVPAWRRLTRSWRFGAAAAAALAVVALGALAISRRSPAGAGTLVPTLAVLPFANLTGDAQREYLCEGISSVLIQQLSAIPGLSVVGRSETWAYKNQSKTSRVIARELGVGAILEGQVLRVGDRLRVQANLLDASNGFVLWSRPVEGTIEEILSLQAEMAHEISRRLAPTLSGGEREALARVPTTSREAYDLYLRAIQILDQVDNPQRLDLARDLLEKAIGLDPAFALSRARLSQTLTESYVRDRDPALLARAEEEAKTALRDDPAMTDARIALAQALRNSGRGEEATGQLRELVARHPESDAALIELAEAYEQAGDASAAETAIRQALAIRPAYWYHWNELGGLLMDRSDDYDAARRAFQKAEELAPPDVSWPTQNLANLAVVQGDFQAALAAYDRVPRPINDAELATNIGTTLFYAGRMNEVEEYYRLAIRLQPKEALFHANLGDFQVRQRQTDRARRSYAEAARLLAAELVVNPDALGLALARAVYLAKAGQCAVGLGEARRAEATAEKNARTAHRLAQAHALCGKQEEALRYLRTAIERGYAPSRIAGEDEFKSLANQPEFQRLLAAKPP